MTPANLHELRINLDLCPFPNTVSELIETRERLRHQLQIISAVWTDREPTLLAWERETLASIRSMLAATEVETVEDNQLGQRRF